MSQRLQSLIRLPPDHVEQRVQVERLGHELHRLAMKNAGFVFAADGDDAAGAVTAGELHAVMNELEAVHDRHAQVGEQNVEALGEQISESLFAVARGDDVAAGLANESAHRLS